MGFNWAIGTKVSKSHEKKTIEGLLLVHTIYFTTILHALEICTAIKQTQ